MALFNTIQFIMNHPLNQQRKLGSLAHFLRWQIGSRLVPGEVVYDWVHGAKFLVKRGETGLTGNIYTGLHEFSDMAFLLHFLRKEDLFVDVGANVGSYTILAGAVVGARGIAFEPIPSTYHRLVENIRLNHLDTQVKLINKGVGAKPGWLYFSSDCDTTNHALMPEEAHEKNKVTAEMTSLDTALCGENPSLIKIDVEGYETPVIEGAEETLKNQSLSAVILELNASGARYGFHESKILELMLFNGFKAYSYEPFRRALINLEDDKNQDAANTLFIRNKEFVEDRLKNAAQLTIHGRTF